MKAMMKRALALVVALLLPLLAVALAEGGDGYAVTITASGYGTVTADQTENVPEGATVALTVTPSAQSVRSMRS